MTARIFFSGLAVPAVLFTLLYFPALKHSLVLASPYPKADVRKRVYGAAVDSLIVSSCWISYWNAGSIPRALFAMLYLLLRDSHRGQSIGKLLVGHVVIQVNTGQRCGLSGSIKRNLLLIVPGANLVAVVLEGPAVLLLSSGTKTYEIFR